MATWQRARPSILDSLLLLQESNLPKLWNLLPISRRREIGMDTRNEMCKGTKKGDK
jgi:hypothetical protein